MGEEEALEAMQKQQVMPITMVRTLAYHGGSY
jgi:hypothetical protein